MKIVERWLNGYMIICIKAPIISKKIQLYTERNFSDQRPAFQEYLNVFENYLRSHSGGRKDAKNARNEKSQIRRMAEVIAAGEIPNYSMFFDLPSVERRWVREHAKKKKYEPGTIRSYLLTLGHFMDFLIRSKVTPDVSNVLPVGDLSVERMNVCRDDVCKWRQSLKPEEEERKFAVMVEAGDNIIQKSEFWAVLESDFYKAVVAKINNIDENYSLHPEGYLAQRDTFTNIRDCLFFNFVVNNMSRSGAASNMTCDEYKSGKISPAGQYVVLVKKHKTSRSYGPCQIVMKQDVKKYCDTYLDIVRNAVQVENPVLSLLHGLGWD